MKIGDLVKMKRGYSALGVVLCFINDQDDNTWVKILWSDAGRGSELMNDLEIIQYGNR